MAITSFLFLSFFTILIILFYIVPKKLQWVLLLIASVVFYILAGTQYTIIYLVLSIVTVYMASAKIEKLQMQNADKPEGSIQAKVILVSTLCINFCLLIFFKYNVACISVIEFICRNLNMQIKISQSDFIASLGISFYTFQITAYLLDVYWGKVSSQKNIWKLGLFVFYFPQILSGPISRYSQLEKQLYAEHKLDYNQITFGLQRMAWGFFKKLVISERLAVVVDTVYADIGTYSGFAVWVGIFAFVLQLYADFSGYMDIILGVSQCFGIVLPENFATPLFSKTIQEFWQRWHITLGGWMRDYLLYPILKSGLWQKLGKFLKSRFGKGIGRKVPTYLGMLIIWLAIGMWHGGAWKYVVGMGIWFFLLIVIEQVTSGMSQKLMQFLRINRECFSYHVFQGIRTFLLVSIGFVFFRAESFGAAVNILKRAVCNLDAEFFVNGSIYQLGLDVQEVRICIVSLVILFGVSIMKQAKNVREWIAGQNLPFRWLIYTAMLFATLLLGYYGTGYDAQAFIYQMF